MPRFADMQVSAFLDALASASPTPGGGTAAAVAGAMGASLLMMVAGLAKSRTGAEDEIVALKEAGARLKSVRDRLSALADADTDAYDRVMAAYRLPRITEPETSARKTAIQHALREATTAPLETLRTAGEAMRLARIVAEHGNRNAASDVGVGIGLIQAAADGAAANVRANLGGLQDEAFGTSARDDASAIALRIAADADVAKRALER